MSLRKRIRRLPAASTIRLARLNVLARLSAHQDFRPFVRPDTDAWKQARADAADGKRVLIATNIGGHFGLAQIDRLLAVALTLRGANVTTALCDRILPACQMCEINLMPNVEAFGRNGPPAMLCSYCWHAARRRCDEIGLPVAPLSTYLTPADITEAEDLSAGVALSKLKTFALDGLPVGEHALAGALRYYARGDLDGEPLAERIARRFLVATIVTARAYRRMIEELQPEVVVAHHGIYVPQGIVTVLARSLGVRVVAWNPAYRTHCFMFSHDDTYHRTLMDEDVNAWRSRPLTPAQRVVIKRYLASRRTGTNDWIRFHRDPAAQRIDNLALVGADLSKPVVLALTNVFWDAQLHYPANAFACQGEWLIETIRHFAIRPDLQLIIRIHPAEVFGSPPSRQLALQEIGKAFSRLPDNVIVVPPESDISTYDLAACADSALIYATKTGVELAATGLPVIVAGEAWVRGKGITHDALSPAHYKELLSALPFKSRLDEKRRSLALAYAYHFFFCRMLPIELVSAVAGPRRFTIAVESLDELREGFCQGLDVICSGILSGTPFVMPRDAAHPA